MLTSRVFIKDSHAKKLMMKYCTDKLTRAEYITLKVTHLQSICSLLNILHSITQTATFTAPSVYQSFFQDIARNGPACALMQGAGESDMTNLKDILSKNLPIFSAGYSTRRSQLDKTFPLFSSLMRKVRVGDCVPAPLRLVLLDVMKVSERLYMPPNSHNQYEPDEEEELLFGTTSFFPSLPRLHKIKPGTTSIATKMS